MVARDTRTVRKIEMRVSSLNAAGWVVVTGWAGKGPGLRGWPGAQGDSEHRVERLAPRHRHRKTLQILRETQAPFPSHPPAKPVDGQLSLKGK